MHFYSWDVFSLVSLLISIFLDESQKFSNLLLLASDIQPDT